MATPQYGRSPETLAAGAARITHFVEKYSFLPASAASPSSQLRSAPAPKEKVVLITGTTGNLGSDLLAILLGDPTVKRVYALNRKSKHGSSRERVGQQFEEKGLPEQLLDSEKAALIEGDLGHPTLGLGEEDYERLRAEVTIIIHNAWPVGYIQPLARFEPSLLGLYNLLTFARSIPESKHPRFVFISSHASAFLWRVYEKESKIPEELIHNHGVAIGLGYAESKYIAEHIVARSGLNATSLRVTQLCGRTSDGAWSPTEWMPMMVKVMQEIGTLPSILTAKLVPFLPLDAAAAIIQDIALSPLHLPPILNVCHPRPSGWDTYAPALQKHIWGPKPMKVIPTTEWIQLVEQEMAQKLGPGAAKFIHRLFSLTAVIMPSNSAFDDVTIEEFPAPACSMERAQEISATLRNLPMLRTGDFERWLKYWISIGFIEPAPEAHVEARL